jgi:hypothetical protein
MKRGSACSFPSKDPIVRQPPARRCFRCWVYLLSLNERSLERVNAGLARARANGTKLGRRRVDPNVEAKILELKAAGDGILKIGRKLGIGTSVVQRVFKQEPRPSERVRFSRSRNVLESARDVAALKAGQRARRYQNNFG